MMKEEMAQLKRARAYSNQDFILVETSSGWGRYTADPNGLEIYLRPDASDNELGQAVLNALSKSRAVINDLELMDWRKIEVRYREWVARVMKSYSYKTKRAMFKDMMSCRIELNPIRDRLDLVPLIHRNLEGWGRESNDDIENVTISATSTSPEIGFALRQAFSRCQ